MHFFLAGEPVWQALLDVLGRNDWPEKQRLQMKGTRSADWPLVKRHLETWCEQRTRSEVLMTCQSRSIPSAPVNTPDRLVKDEHIADRGTLISVGGLMMPGAPVQLSGTPFALTETAPILGQHTESVLTELLGYDKSGLAALRGSHAI